MHSSRSIEVMTNIILSAPGQFYWFTGDFTQQRSIHRIINIISSTEATTASLQSIRLALRDRLHTATTVGYGPRFLHSTGQLHKGGANNGLFLQLLDEPDDDLAVPESDFAFGDLIAAQAEGDFQALSRRGRRVLRVQLGRDVASGLATLGGLLNA